MIKLFVRKSGLGAGWVPGWVPGICNDFNAIGGVGCQFILKPYIK